MLEINLVNLVQAGGLSIILFGLYLLKDYAHYNTINILLVYSGLSTVTNFSEEVLGSRDWYLVSPVYLLGIGPMFYLCVLSLTQNKTQIKHFVHLVPVLLALPFTHHPQWVIAVGTLWFFTYAWFIRNAVLVFELRIRSENSNIEELSMKWFMNLVVAVAVIYTLDFMRLNLQPYIGQAWNNTGQLVGNVAIFAALAYLLKKLLQYNEDIVLYQREVFSADSAESGAPKHQNTESQIHENPTQYESVFQYLQGQIIGEKLFREPRLSLAQLAQQTGLQTRDISRAINLCSELNFNDYINQHRVEAIKTELLENPEAQLLETGLRNGFNSKTSFNNVFKRLTGMTPGQYRANNLR